MIFVRLKNRVVTGVLLSVICGGAVAEKDNTAIPEIENEVEMIQTEQPEHVLRVTDIDKLQLELAREISIGEQASALKALADSFADLPPDAVKALLERGGERGRLQRTVEALHAQRGVETNSIATTDDIVSIGEQASVLKALSDSFADLPPDAVKALLERGGEPGYLQRAVEALYAQQVETKPLATDIASIGEQKQTIIYTAQPLPEPKLTAENIVYIEVPKADYIGRVILRFEQSSYSVAVGESFTIRQAHFRNKHYRVIAIQYRSPSEIELRLETEGRTTHLIKKI